MKKNRIEILTTIAVRAEEELNLTKLFISNKTWDKYDGLIDRNFDFYRDFSRRKLLTDLEQEKLENERERSNNSVLRSFESTINGQEDTEMCQSDERKPIFRDLGKKLKAGEEIVVSADNIIKISFGFIKKIIDLVG